MPADATILFDRAAIHSNGVFREFDCQSDVEGSSLQEVDCCQSGVQAFSLQEVDSQLRDNFFSLGGRGFSPDVKLHYEPASAAEESSCVKQATATTAS